MPPPGGCRNFRKFGGPQEERNSPKSTGLAGESDGKYLAWLLDLKRHLKAQSRGAWVPQSLSICLQGSLLFLLPLLPLVFPPQHTHPGQINEIQSFKKKKVQSKIPYEKLHQSR